jgi:hypothetical protein
MILVPRIQGLPLQICGSMLMRSNRMETLLDQIPQQTLEELSHDNKLAQVGQRMFLS